MTRIESLRRLSGVATGAGLLLALVGLCPPALAADAKPLACAASGPVDLPAGMSLERMRLLDEGKNYKVYTSVEYADERTKGQFPAAMSKQVDMSPGGLSRIFSDVILGARRFRVYEMAAGVTAEHSDVMVKARIVDADQVQKQSMEGGRTLYESKVTLSVQVQNMYTGLNLLETAVKVDGRTGLQSQDRVVLTSADRLDSDEVRARLALDFKNALNRAFAQASDKVEELLRPLARVVGAEDCSVTLFGGSRFGLQANDDLVVFRVKTRQLGETTVLGSMNEVALIRCRAVGVDDSACKVLRAVPGYRPQDGDFALITDESLKRTRTR